MEDYISWDEEWHPANGDVVDYIVCLTGFVERLPVADVVAPNWLVFTDKQHFPPEMTDEEIYYAKTYCMWLRCANSNGVYYKHAFAERRWRTFYAMFADFCERINHNSKYLGTKIPQPPHFT